MATPLRLVGAVVFLVGLLWCAQCAPIALPLRRHRLPSDSFNAAPRTWPQDRNPTRFNLERMNLAADTPVPLTPPPFEFLSVEFGVGTPSQKFHLAVDTMSCDTIIPGSMCTLCTNNTRYTPSASSTSRAVPCRGHFGQDCDFSVLDTFCYGDPRRTCYGTGLMYLDDFSLAGFSGGMSVGALNSISAGYAAYHVLDGTLGVGCRMSEDYPQVQSLMGVLDASIKGQFGYCLDSTHQGGLLMFGGVPSKYVTGDFQYTKFLMNYQNDPNALYAVNLSDISVASKSIGVNPSYFFGDHEAGFGTMINSASSLLVLGPSAFMSLENLFADLCTSVNLPGVCTPVHSIFNYGVCVPMTQDQIALFPPLTLTFWPDIQATVDPKDYLYESAPGSGKFCLGIRQGSAHRPAQVGTLLLSRYTLLFNRYDGALGIAKTNPDTCKYSATN